jgi:hypothetical protein
MRYVIIGSNESEHLEFTVGTVATQLDADFTIMQLLEENPENSYRWEIECNEYV